MFSFVDEVTFIIAYCCVSLQLFDGIEFLLKIDFLSDSVCNRNRMTSILKFIYVHCVFTVHCCAKRLLKFATFIRFDLRDNDTVYPFVEAGLHIDSECAQERKFAQNVIIDVIL